MSNRADLLESIAQSIADYREGEVERPTPDHVDAWVGQFDEVVQEPILHELDHVLKETYVTKVNFNEFITNLVASEKLAGTDPCTFWKSVRFLSIQGGGNSQRDLLKLFDPLLRAKCGYGVGDCDGDDTFIYLDDAVFTGNRVLGDLRSWIQADAPSKSTVHVVTIAYHRGGQWYAQTSLEKIAKEVGKEIHITWWRAIEIEDRKSYTDSSDV